MLTDQLATLLEDANRKGVRLWSENGRLQYQAPKGALTTEELNALRSCRDQILALLDSASAERAPEFRAPIGVSADRAPLSFSQLAHWQVYRLADRPAIRQIASATRINGRLNIGVLQRCFLAVASRHDALRTRIVTVDEVPLQQTVISYDHELICNDLTHVPIGEQSVEVTRLIEELILEPIDLSVGPLFGGRLLRLRSDQHVLILAMEHMISDAVSMGIVLEEIFVYYAALLQKKIPAVSLRPVQFADYASWQRNVQLTWLERQAAYWMQCLREVKRFPIPPESSAISRERIGWGVAPVVISGSVKRDLRAWCRVRHTTLVTAVLTAYVALVLRWCKRCDALIQYESGGRMIPQTENAVGYFASVLYLPISVQAGNTFDDLLKTVTDRLCNAYQHVDFSFLEAQVPRPDFTRCTGFNWVSQGPSPNLAALQGSKWEIECSPIAFEHPMLKNMDRDSDPVMLLFEEEESIEGGVYFPLGRFPMSNMEEFGHDFIKLIGALIREPESRIDVVRILD